MPSLRDMLNKMKEQPQEQKKPQPALVIPAQPQPKPVEPPAPVIVATPVPPGPAAKVGSSLLGKLKANAAPQQVLQKPAVPPVQTVASKPQPIPQPVAPVVIAPVVQVKSTEPTAPPPLAGDPGISDPALAEIKKNIQFLSDNIEEKELVGQVVRTIMQQMRKNPHFRSQLTATDMENIVRGFRRTFAVAARKKVEGAEKRGRKAAEVNEIDQMMKDMDMGDIDFSNVRF